MRVPTRPWLILACCLALGLAACQNQNRRSPLREAPPEPRPDPINTVTRNPHAHVQGDQFQRVNALVGQWDLAQSESALEQADRIALMIQREVDANYPGFVEASRGTQGAANQYLATSALGFASNAGATQVLLERLGDQDQRVVSNAMVALNERADPDTPLGPVVKFIDPRAPLLPKRYAPLVFATIVEARRASGRPLPNEGTETALARLGTIANDRDGYTRLHVTKALGVIGTPGAVDLLVARMNDQQMRVRWAAAAALERSGDPRGFTEVVRLLNDVAPASKHIIRDVLASYAGRIQGRPLTTTEIMELADNPAAWSRWFTRYQASRGVRLPDGTGS